MIDQDTIVIESRFPLGIDIFIHGDSIITERFMMEATPDAFGSSTGILVPIADTHPAPDTALAALQL